MLSIATSLTYLLLTACFGLLVAIATHTWGKR